MKKLALALVCLFSVAFFASCDPDITNPEPSIQALQGDEYIQDNDIVDLDTPYAFGFVVASNPQTNKDLASLVVKVGDMLWDSVNLTGLKEYTLIDTVEWGLAKDIVYTDIITAVVTDVDGKTATATLNVSVNQPAEPLVGTTIEWIRKGANLIGNTETEMRARGLQWTGSYKEVFATIKPIDGATLYVCDGEDFAGITNTAEKAAYFANLAETGTAVDSYRNITTNNDADYNDMLAVVKGEETFLVRISHADIETGNYGTQITITGEAK